MTEQIGPWVDKLNSMASADEIAKFFEEEKVQGIRKMASGCAVSVFLREMTGQRVVTGPSDAAIYPHLENGKWVQERAVFEPVVTKFIRHFDMGLYPKLDVLATPPPGGDRD